MFCLRFNGKTAQYNTPYLYYNNRIQNLNLFCDYRLIELTFRKSNYGDEEYFKYHLIGYLPAIFAITIKCLLRKILRIRL